MYSQGKYVTGEIKTDRMSVLGAIVIPETVPHNSIKDCFEEITGAGFFKFDKDKVTVFGESTGLGVSPTEIDEILVGRSISHPKYVR